MSSNLTQAKKNVRDLTNTWELWVSRLWKLFSSVTDEIKLSRQELTKLWKSTAWIDKIDNELTQLQKRFEAWEISAEKFRRSLNTINNQAIKSSDWLEKVWKRVNGLIDGLKGLAIIEVTRRALASVINTSIEFETAFVWVEKTVEGTAQEFAVLEKNLKVLSTQLWTSFVELSRIAQVWGQLWIPIQNLTKFTQVAAWLWEATNVAWETAATALAQIIAVTSNTIDDIDRLWASLVWLGNNFETNEWRILDFANELKSTSWIAGLTGQDLLWIATWFSALWIEAEAWGSAVTKAILEINNTVNQWGEDLQEYARLTWQSADEFVKSWQENAAGAFVNFVEWLWREGDKANVTLQALLWTDIRLTKAFLSAANWWDKLRQAIERANVEFEKNEALQREVNARLDTTQASLDKSSARFRALSDQIWDGLKWPWAAFLELLSTTLPKVLDTTWALITKLVAQIQFGLWQLSLGFEKFVVESELNLLNRARWIADFFKIDIDNTLLWKRLDERQQQLEAITNTAKVNADRISAFNEGIDKGLGEALSKFDDIESIDNIWAAEVTKDILSLNDSVEDTQNIIKDTTDSTKKLTREQEKAARDEKKRQEAIKRSAEKNEKAKQKAYKDTLKTFEDTYEKADDIFDDFIKSSEKNIDKLNDSIDDLKNNIKSIDEEIADLDASRVETLWERNIEINEKQADIQDEISDIRRDGVTWEEAWRLNDLQAQLKALEEEKTLIEGNLTAEQIAEAERTAALSPTERLLQEIEAEKQALEDKKAITEQEIANLEAQKAQEEVILKNFNDEKIALSERFADIEIQLEKKITDNLREENRQRINSLEALKQKALETAAALRSTWINLSGVSSAASSDSWGSTDNSTTTTNTFNFSGLWTKEVERVVTDVVVKWNKNSLKGND